MTVTLIRLSAREEDRVAVTFEIRSGEHTHIETFVVSAFRVADLSLCRGESTQECYDAVSMVAQLDQAVEKGLHLLGYGSSSRRALVRKLTERGFSQEIAAAAAEELCRQGYLNEEAQAVREAERCVEKLWGEKRIVVALRAKGYSSESIKRALFTIEDEEVDFEEVCAERIRRYMRELPSDPRERQKWMAALSRYGFSASQIRGALNRLFCE